MPRFSWNVETMKSDFEVSPPCGYCSPGSEVAFTCVFKPSFQASCIQQEVIIRFIHVSLFS